MQIWDAQSDGFVRFDGEDIINEDSTQNGILGCIAEDAALTAALFESMKGYVNSTAEGEASPSKKKGVDCFFGRTASKIHVPAYKTHSLGPAVVDLMDVKDRSVKTVTCRLVVGADGAQSAVRRLAGIPSWGWTYGQEAVVATVEMPADSEGEATAWQRYLPTGPIALLPLWEGYGNIVWSVPTTRAKQLTAMKNSEFIGELNKALNEDFETTAESTPVLNTTGQTVPHTIPGLLRHAVLAPVNTVQNELKALVGTVSSVFELNSAGYYTESSKNGGSRGSAGKAVGKQKPPVISADGLESRLVSFPLQFQQASTYYAPRVALAGDAAHSIHPQAGQGLNLGIEDVSMLCDAILGAMSAGADYGDTDVLQKYGQQSYLRNLQMLLTVDAINATFAAGNAEVHAPLMSSDGKDTNTTLPLRAGVIGSLLSISEKVIPGAAFRDARALGMLALNASPSLKKRVAAYAMGLQR
jgi:ubiquinone biosynthesis monooxygenase Coq6